MMRKHILFALALIPFSAFAVEYNFHNAGPTGSYSWTYSGPRSGSPSGVTQNVGWFPTTTTNSTGGPLARHSGSATLPGGRTPLVIDVTSRVKNPGSLLAGAARVATPIGAALTAAAILQPLLEMGIEQMTKVDDTTWKATTYKPRSDEQWTNTDGCPGVWMSASQACAAVAKCDTTGQNRFSGATGTVAGPISGTPPNRAAMCERSILVGTDLFTGPGGMVVSAPNTMPERQTETWSQRTFEDKLEEALKPGLPPAALEELSDIIDGKKSSGGVSPVLVPNSVSGPSTYDGKPTTTTTQMPDNSELTTTKTPRYTVRYEGDKMLIDKTETTVTEVKSPTGEVTSTTTTQTTTSAPETFPTSSRSGGAPPGEQVLNCEGPDRTTSQCAELGDPKDEDIPKKEIDVTKQPSPWNFGSNGQCLQSVNVSMRLMQGQSLTVLDTSKSCEIIGGPFRAVVLLFAAITALMIVLPQE